MKFTPNLVVGVVITIVGVVLMLDRLGLLEIRQALQLWPVMVTVFGISVVVQALRADGTPASHRPIIGPGLVLVLAIGTVIAMRADEGRLSPRGAPDDAEISLVGIMGRDDRVSLSPAFRGAEMTTLMGRTRLDLRQATLESGADAVIDVFGMWGAVEVIVPEHWTVDVQTWAMMGGTQDNRRRGREQPGRDRDRAPDKTTATEPLPPATAPPTTTPAPRVVIKGTILMGGLVIRS